MAGFSMTNLLILFVGLIILNIVITREAFDGGINLNDLLKTFMTINPASPGIKIDASGNITYDPSKQYTPPSTLPRVVPESPPPAINTPTGHCYANPSSIPPPSDKSSCPPPEPSCKTETCATDCTNQGQQYQDACAFLKSYVQPPKPPAMPNYPPPPPPIDLSLYVKKDEIPCWGCTF